MSSDLLEQLNPEQREAATYGDGPLLVIAGAGTGKTQTITSRVAYLVKKGVPPNRILLLTFTRRAAAEMIRRAEHLLGESMQGKLWGGTFHATATRLLRQYGRAIGLNPGFTIMDQGDAADLMNLIQTDLGLAEREKRFPKKRMLVDIYSHVINAQAKLTDVLKDHFPWCAGEEEDIKQIFDGYLERKREQDLVDYDDLLLLWVSLCNHPQAGPASSDRFEHVLVDEYQDTNALQADILRGMRRRHKNIMVVGDDAQAIYSFRAATVRNILDFPKHFPSVQVVKLE